MQLIVAVDGGNSQPPTEQARAVSVDFDTVVAKGTPALGRATLSGKATLFSYVPTMLTSEDKEAIVGKLPPSAHRASFSYFGHWPILCWAIAAIIPPEAFWAN
ncbi:MAG: hypothetical protein GWP61_04275 [Chloroflexi bacterium]|jgi:hypothetical protein|nr:hypothetical protein [Chloroflexota bacterium]